MDINIVDSGYKKHLNFFPSVRALKKMLSWDKVYLIRTEFPRKIFFHPRYWRNHRLNEELVSVF